MKAVMCNEFGGPDKLVITEVPSLTPKEGEVIISVKAAGLNFPDTLIIQGRYQFQPELPFSPGGEVAGVIKEVGAGVTHIKVGDRVVSGTSWGGFAEEVRGYASNTFVIPDRMNFVDAAGSLMTYATSYHALEDRGNLKAGETLLVLGAAGGVGTAAIQIGKLLGAHVIACASTDDKLAYCQSIGADEVINYSTENLKDAAKILTKGKGADVVFDPIGGDLSESAFRAIARGGRHLVVGFATGQIPKLPFNLPLLKSASIVGVFWGGFFRNEPEKNRTNVIQLLKWFESGELKPQIEKVYPLEDFRLALESVINKDVKGKIVLVV
ncbi:MAG: NADPH:quinone oxidoreductase family protein [Reichenbachiella sp.]